MRRPRPVPGPLRAAVLASLAALALSSVSPAQQPAAPTGGEPAAPAPPAPTPDKPAAKAPEAIAPENVVSRAASTEQTLQDLETRAAVQPRVEDVAKRLREVQGVWPEQARDMLQRLSRESEPAFVDEAQRTWSTREGQVAGWIQTLGDRAGALTDALDQIDQLKATWELTRDADHDLPAAVRGQIRDVLEAIASTRGKLRERRDAILTLQSAALEQQKRVTEVQTAVGAAQERLRSRLGVRDSPPLWQALADAQPAEARARVWAAWRESGDRLRTYLVEHPDELGVYGLSLVVLVATVAFLGRRAIRWAEGDPDFAASARVLARPVSAALLVMLVGYPVLLPAAPLLVRWLAGLLVIVPALRLIVPLVEGPARRAVYLLSLWFAVDSLRTLLQSAPVLVRLMLVLEAAAALAFLVWLLRPRRLAALGPLTGGLRALGGAARIGAVLLAVSLLANLVGNASLAGVLVQGTLLGAYAAVLLQGTALVLDSLWAVLLHTRLLRMLRGVQRHEPMLRRRGARIVRVALVLLWLWLTLGFFRLREPVEQGIEAVLTATWPVGELDLSLGDVVAFGLTIWISIWLSRFLRFVLDEDVLPRTRLPRGVPYAISAGTGYVVLLLGFLVAVSAAGFDMSKFALIVGALGVGIGIGLQEVVNNFVSGLILLFERPVQTGDTVQVGELFGEVRRIGMRSSTVRTWSGAEVIVPNSKLVSDNVINWTLSDNLRRVEIPIGVAYGTDPERVLELLIEVARSHTRVLAEPAPSALFQAHGNSSLDFELRAWTSAGDWFVVKSDLTVAINRALREAGIEIPFPQRDLHLRSVDPKVREALRGAADE